MTVTTKEIFDHMRPNLTTDQVQALHKLMEKGADLDTIGRFAGVPIKVQTAAIPKPNGFKFGATSLKRLEGINPRLRKVVDRALEIAVVHNIKYRGPDHHYDSQDCAHDTFRQDFNCLSAHLSSPFQGLNPNRSCHG